MRKRELVRDEIIIFSSSLLLTLTQSHSILFYSAQLEKKRQSKQIQIPFHNINNTF